MTNPQVDSGIVRIGILGASSVAVYALIEPAARDNGIRAAAVGSRDPHGARAVAYAAAHGVPRVMSYEALLAAPDIDAIYVSLPNALHCEWSIRALDAGKPVLCEKPLASNADEARRMAAASMRAGLPLVEAFHWRWHPLALRLSEIVRSGELGSLRRAQARFLIPSSWTSPDNIRFDYTLSGGATMDMGCYAINFLRMVLGEPEAVVAANAIVETPHIDSEMDAVLAFAGGRMGRFRVSYLYPFTDLVIDAEIVGEAGCLYVTGLFVPHWGHRLDLQIGDEIRREQLPLTPSFDCQARGFAALVRGVGQNLTPASDGALTLRAVDLVYDKAGLPRRGLSFDRTAC